MDAVDVEEATAELYALTPAGFTARRTELVAQARQEGHKALAKEISELRRPTVSAWLVNQLARGAGGGRQEVQELEQLGADLRAAQAELDGPRMKDLARQRQKLVAALVRVAETVADEDGQKLSAGVRREVEETLGAAVADEQAALAVFSGRLTRALVYAGFGEVDVTAATATPVKPRHLTDASSTTPSKKATGEHSSSKNKDKSEDKREDEDKRTAAARQEATEAAELARSDEAAAVDDLEAAAQHRDELRAQEAELTETLDGLQREIVRVRHELDGLTRSLATADRDHERRRRQVEQARRAVRQADQALTDLP